MGRWKKQVRFLSTDSIPHNFSLHSKQGLFIVEGMSIEERDQIRKETGIPGKTYNGRRELPVSDCGDPLQDIINDINTVMKHNNEFWGYA